MEEKLCGSCEHFQQHYALSGNKLFRVYCGYCLFARPKRKNFDTPACSNYKTGSTIIEGFASMEYLTKTLLQHVLSLPLFPGIEEDDPNHQTK